MNRKEEVQIERGGQPAKLFVFANCRGAIHRTPSVYDALLPQTRLRPYLDQIGLTRMEAANDDDYANRRAA